MGTPALVVQRGRRRWRRRVRRAATRATLADAIGRACCSSRWASTCCWRSGSTSSSATAGLLDLGYVAFYAVGAYTTAKLTTTAGWTTGRRCSSPIARRDGRGRGARRRRRCACAATTWPSSRSASARSCASSPRTPSPSARRGASPAIPHPARRLGCEFAFDPLPYYYLTLAAIVLSDRDDRAAAAARASGGRGRRSARTRTRPSRWACPRSRMKLWAFAIGASTGGLGGLDLRQQGELHQPRQLPVLPLGHHPVRGGARRHGLDARRHRRRLRDRLPPRVPARRRPPARRSPTG